MDSIKTINEVNGGSETVLNSHGQPEDTGKLDSMHSVSVSLNVNSKRSKYAKSNISSAVVSNTPEVTIQTPTPAKGASKVDEKNEKPATKAKSKRMSYAKKTWASTPVDGIVSNNSDRFGKVMPLQFDPNFIGQNMPIMGNNNRRNSPSGMSRGIKMIPPVMNMAMQNPMANVMPQMNYQMQNMSLNNQNQFFQGMNTATNRPMTMPMNQADQLNQMMSMNQADQLNQMIPTHAQIITQNNANSLPMKASNYSNSDTTNTNSSQSMMPVMASNTMIQPTKILQNKVSITFNPMNMVEMTRNYLSFMKDISADICPK